MTTITSLTHNLLEAKKNIAYSDAAAVFASLYRTANRPLLLESKDVSRVYGRMSIIGVDPCISIIGKDDQFEITRLNERGSFFFSFFKNADFSFCDEVTVTETKITGTAVCDRNDIEESKRTFRKNCAQAIRAILASFKVESSHLLGLYGAFSYDFVRLFEDIAAALPENDIPDFNLALYDTFIRFDHLKEKADIIVFRENTHATEQAMQELEEKIAKKGPINPPFSVKNNEYAFTQQEYEALVEKARDYAKAGEFFEVVFANTLTADFTGDPFGLYTLYREINPSPYMYYIDLGGEYLVGASPEMMVRVENGKAHLRPISGTAKRGSDPIEDHENMCALLACKKERAELDMLIDLGRNDLSRICEAGIEISDYRFVEKYSRVMHTVAHLTGKLQDGRTALDALIACSNAGTLTGAPKVAAMQCIEDHEKERRGYYGGSVGYLTFSGDMDTGIIIRTAHIKNQKLNFKVGATLLYNSVPESEFKETIHKAQAFLETVTA